VGGNQVSYNGHTWQAKWWTQGETPGKADVWADKGPCGGSTTTPPPGGGSCTLPAWSATTVYVGGNQVSYNGHKYTAKWWTLGETPGRADVWQDNGPC
jgi:chitinase